jgi:hypothetical protein
MGIYTNNTASAADDVEVNYGELMEQFAYDEMASLSDDEKKALFESGEIALLEKKNLINKRTIVRLNKNDDISRRTTMANLQLAKDSNDSLWKALKKNRIQERKLLAMINKKFGSKGHKVAMVGQREYLKNVNKSKMLKTSDISHRD